MNKIQIIRNCKSCLYHYWVDLEDDECYQKGGCSQFTPVGLRLEDVEVVEELGLIDYCNGIESDI